MCDIHSNEENGLLPLTRMEGKDLRWNANKISEFEFWLGSG